MLRMSIGNSDNMFEVKIIGSEVERILMFNKIGMLVFEQDGENLEKVQNLVCLIPLVEGMEVAETKQELKISYGMGSKEYKVKMKNLSGVKKLKAKIEEQMEANLARKTRQLEKYQFLFDDLWIVAFLSYLTNQD